MCALRRTDKKLPALQVSLHDSVKAAALQQFSSKARQNFGKLDDLSAHWIANGVSTEVEKVDWLTEAINADGEVSALSKKMSCIQVGGFCIEDIRVQVDAT